MAIPEGVPNSAAVQRVADALRASGRAAQIMGLSQTARSAADAAASVGCPLGAIVKSLVFQIAGQPVMALVAGDRLCDTGQLPAVLGIDGKCKRADADMVRAATGFSIGGVAPLGLKQELVMAIDTSLGRFDAIYAAAGHPFCVFQTNLEELARMTGAITDPRVGKAE